MPSTESVERIKALGRQVMLSGRTLEKTACSVTPKQAAAIIGLFESELALRGENKRRRLVRRAAFPALKFFAGYDWTSAVLPKTLTREDLLDVTFVPRGENIICYGPVGTGKTHLAIAVGYACCQMGLKVKFTTTSELVLRLVSARETGTLEKVLADYASNDLTILDEFGYVPIDREGSRLLFQVISRCYESKSLMLTTNLEFSRWASVLTEEQMASAMADRLLHHGHVITFRGESYRIKNALMNKGGSCDGR
jgi:DNA replication protein DnaC